MASTRSDLDADDDFSDIYKEYTGPPAVVVNNTQNREKPNKRSLAGSDEEEETRDPNAVPTDFTSREAKVWEAKSKATERNWKKRKEEELICKICGESGHFTQGCPSTLGANRKSQDFFERVPARDKHVKELFTEKVMHRIQSDIGCKLKMEEKFLIVSGKDRLVLAKGVDAVHKVIKEGEHKVSSGSHRSKSRSPKRSPVGSRPRHHESQRSHSHPQNASQFQQRFGKQDKVLEDRIREDQRKISRGSPQANVNDGARSRSSHSKSPGLAPPYSGNSFTPYDNNTSASGYKTDGWDTDRRGSDIRLSHQFEYPAFVQTLEEFELGYKREAMDLERIRDKEEDEENYKHRETMREMRETYMKKLTTIRSMHAQQWEEFLQLDSQKREQHARQQMSHPSFGSYKQHTYSEYGGSSGKPNYSGPTRHMDAGGRYVNPMENYNSRSQEPYVEFERQRHEDYRKAYKRY